MTLFIRGHGAILAGNAAAREPDHFKAWYGPAGATIPVAKMDVRIGGTRLVCVEMQSPGGPM